MASTSTLSISTVNERIKKGEIVYQLTFRFSVGHKSWDLQKIHNEIEERGWQKLPDLDCMFVWFGDDPRDVLDILKKNSFENHICRYYTGILRGIEQFEGTGTPPVRSEEKRQASRNRSILDFCSKKVSNENDSSQVNTK